MFKKAGIFMSPKLNCSDVMPHFLFIPTALPFGMMLDKNKI